MSLPPHGITRYTSKTHPCRCAKCRKAVRDQHNIWRREVKSQRVTVDGKLFNPSAPHGTETGYGDYGCRCAPCAKARRLSVWNREHPRVARPEGMHADLSDADKLARRVVLQKLDVFRSEVQAIHQRRNPVVIEARAMGISEKLVALHAGMGKSTIANLFDASKG